MTPRTMLAIGVLALAASTLGCYVGCPHGAHAPPPPPAPPAPAQADKAPPKPRGAEHVYRLDFTLVTTEPGKPQAQSAYSMNVEEQSHGELRIGSNVPLGNARQDVGLLIRAVARPSGDALLLETTTELSTTEEQGAVRKLSMRGDVIAAPGAPAQVASLEDPTTHKRFTLSVVATKLK